MSGEELDHRAADRLLSPRERERASFQTSRASRGWRFGFREWFQATRSWAVGFAGVGGLGFRG